LVIITFLNVCGLNFIISLNKDCKLDHKDKIDLLSMNDLISYRGPDNTDFSCSDYVNFGHNRLSIVDNRAISNQPFLSNNKRILITFNGEIYNFKCLRNKCLSAGYKFKTFSDTEVISSLYEIWGIKGLDELEGMFAFALYDKSQNKVIVRRDRFGIKPLYYMIFRGKLYGSSEIIPLIKISNFKEIDSRSLASIFLYDNNCFDQSLISNIFKLAPGMQILYSNFSLDFEKWFDIKRLTAKKYKDFNDIKSQLEKIICNSIMRESETEVPTCIFYSGGLDSSLISHYASQKNRDIKLFSFIPQSISKSNNDVLNAEQRAHLLGIKNFEYLYFDENNLLKYLDIFSSKLYEPTSDAAIIPTMFLSDIASQQGYKVALTGDGSDELFGGYARYKFLSYYSILSIISRSLKKIYNTFYLPKNLNYKFSRLKNSIDFIDNPEKLYNQLLSLEDILFYKDSFLEINIKDRNEVFLKHSSYLESPKENTNFNLYDAISRADFSNLLSNQYLPKVDNSTMIFGLEARVPFLDDKLVDFILKNRLSLPLPYLQSKPLIRKIAKQVLPKPFTSIPKQGYGVPLREWLSDPLYEYLNSINIADYEKYGFHVNQLKYKDILFKLKNNPKLIDNRELNTLWKLVVITKWETALMKL